MTLRACQGLPKWMTHLLDSFHEHCSEEILPTLSIKLIKPGQTFNQTKNKLNVFILERNRDRVLRLYIKENIKQQVLDAINAVIKINFVDELSVSAANSLADSARAAEYSARSADHPEAWTAEFDIIANEFLRLIKEEQ